MKASSRFDHITPYEFTESSMDLAIRLGLRPNQIVKLDLNENLFGASPRALQALANLNNSHYYSDPNCTNLRTALSDYTGAPADCFIIGNGADELIDLVTHVMLDTNDKVIICPPAFSMYAVCTSLHQGCIIEIPRLPDFQLDLSAITKAVETEQPKVIFITSPNNPDGTLINPKDIESLLKLPILVVLDEAYVEFSEGGSQFGRLNSHVTQVAERENLVVLRTFSKWAGLAGLRIGYGAFPKWLAPVIWKVKLPYNINAAAEAAALGSLQDLDVLAERIKIIQDERKRMVDALSQMAYISPYPSQANFLLCRINKRSAADLYQKLANRGILTRYFGTPPLENCLRISIGRPQDNDRLIEALEKEA